MAEFEERKKFWRIFYSPLVFIILLIVLLFAARAMWRVYGHERTSAQDRARIEKELAAADQRTSALKDQVGILETSKGMEDEIRTKFNVTKAGEKVAIIVDSTGTISTATAPVVEESWWQKVVWLFSH
jgi:hypothetical protein